MVNVARDVYRLAQGSTTPTPVTFGNSHVGDTVSQVLTVQNTAAAEVSPRNLKAGFGSATGSPPTNNSGTVSLLAAGGSDSSAMTVGLNTSSAGAKTGSVNINYVSDGAGTSGLSAISAGSQAISLNGDVYRLASASPATPNPVNFGNVRIGTVTDQALTIGNTALNDGFSEKLNASISSNGAPVTASGAFTLLGPQAIDSTSLHVGIDTGMPAPKRAQRRLRLLPTVPAPAVWVSPLWLRKLLTLPVTSIVWHKAARRRHRSLSATAMLVIRSVKCSPFGTPRLATDSPRA